jgi:hypothetical protein
MRPTCPDILRLQLLALGLFTVLASPAVEAKVSGRVEKVRKLYDQLFFDDAMEACNAVLDAGKNGRADMVELLRYKGVLSAVQNKPAEAVAAFKQLLEVDPLAQLGGGHPPRVQRAFAQARHWFKRQKPLMVAVEAPEEVLRRGTTEIAAQITSDPLGMVAHVLLRLRARGAGEYRSHVIAKGADLRWTIKLDEVAGVARADVLEYYVAALDQGYNELTLAGSPADPRTIRLAGAPAPVRPAAPLVPTRPAPPAASPAWYTHWWIWAAVGTVVTVSVVAIAAATASPPDTVDAPITLESAGGP